MARLCVLVLLIVAACVGQQIPMHSGYKGKNPQPWKKAKALKLNDKLEAKAEGTLSYADYKRAAWYVANLPQGGKLDLHLEVTPPGDATNDDFDLGFEVLDPSNRSIMRSDKEEGDDAGELIKQKALKDLGPGKYLIHLYLQDRRDSADYELDVTFQPMASVGKSDFPALVAFVPTLPKVPINDDTPRTYHPPATTATVTRRPPSHEQKDEPKPPPQPAQTLAARIIGVQVVGGSTQITIARGTSGGAAIGMKGQITGVATGSFTLAACNERTCTATVSATPDQIKGSGSVVLSQ